MSSPTADATNPKATASAIDAATPNFQHRAAAAGSSNGPTASSVPKAWKLATKASTANTGKIAPYGIPGLTARRNAGSNVPTANGRYNPATATTMMLLIAAICSN